MKLKGRGTAKNPPNRFESTETIPVREFTHEGNLPKTEFIPDYSKSIITDNTSPDIPYQSSVNPYRGCEHGCIYCYARPYHEFLGYSGGIDFETKIMVKHHAPELLRNSLQSKSWKPRNVTLSGVTDPYQLIEQKLQLTRECLKVFGEFRNPVSIITKNHLVTRDIDILKKMVPYNCIHVLVSVTTLDIKLCNVLEPRTSRPEKRLEGIRKLSEAGIPVQVMIAPVIPGLNDHEIPAILNAVHSAGASSAQYLLLRLPHSVKELFEHWLKEHYPTKKRKVLNFIRATRKGKLNENNFGVRFRGSGKIAEYIHQLFNTSVHRYGLNNSLPPLSTNHFRKVNNQTELFD